MDKANYPKYLKAPEHGLYFKIISPFSYASVKVLKNEQGLYYSYMKTECTQANTSAIENDMGLKEASETEFNEKMSVFIQLGSAIEKQLTK